MSMSIRIRRARTQALLTQAELARRLGVQRSAVTQWERDAGTRPSVEHLSQIACETSVHFEWLATGRGPLCTDDDAFVDAVVVQDYARDDLEGRVLVALRRITPRKREAVARIVELLSS
ncbi:helix-turn-helix domain-containing protein [Lysobacter panacisoli]|uniref:HTH cro/C1-type domain-containing protein n=1 Tax=Lysobacter panacisoli TaxID=1255263 RepID=A0ABP9LE27_9GAMM|nr:helix-turn-helix transcriptional regulator [Lysobacter panacisoli]